MTSSSPRSLAGANICLVFEGDLTYYTRLRQEVQALREAGATVELLTSHPDRTAAPPGVRVTVAPLALSGQDSRIRWRPLRIAHNLSRTALRTLLTCVSPRWDHRRRVRALGEIAERVDAFWVVDYPGLPTVMDAARHTGTRVMYETVDLVPEYLYHGDKQRKAALDDERRLVREVDGFITACDGYADYYVERYGGREISSRPVVIDNVPTQHTSHPRRTESPLRALFLGSLMPDRPIIELIEAFALVSSDTTLTIQGKNLLGDSPQERITELGLTDRVRIFDSCPPDEVVANASEYDLGIVVLRGMDENEQRASTSKLFTYMAAGLAILGSDLPGIARIVRPCKNGALVSGMDPEDWARAIDHLAELPPATIDAMKRQSLLAAEERSWLRQSPILVAEFARLLADGSTMGAREFPALEQLTERQPRP